MFSMDIVNDEFYMSLRWTWQNVLRAKPGLIRLWAVSSLRMARLQGGNTSGARNTAR